MIGARWRGVISICVGGTLLLAGSVRAAASCTDHDSCVAALKNLQGQYNEKQQVIATKEKVASGYKETFLDLQQEFQATAKKISQTEEGISTTNDDIDEITKRIDEDKDSIAALQKVIHGEIVDLYEHSQLSSVEIFLSGKTLSEALSDVQYIEDIQRSIQEKTEKIQAAKAELEDAKAKLIDKKESLNILSDTLNGNKEDLAVQKKQVNTLLTATQSQIGAYVAQQNAIKKQIAETQKRLQDLINEAHWGSDIVSAAPEGWTYRQLDYGQTLGNSPYTVHDYGCLVTSMAMVASFYGHHVNPGQIANNPRYFTRGGYAQTPALAAGIGLSIQERSGVNWDTVDAALAAGHPVIVSIYIPQVGAINADGSSHFIVLQKKQGKTYLMQDPLGTNRSYGFQYVRSMYILNKA